MRINEIFYSIQGEGPNIGKLSVFVRLAGCNLRCIWCDTKYTWLYSEKTLHNLKLITPDEEQVKLGERVYIKNEEIVDFNILEIINKIQDFPAKNIVLTGGEPLLQKTELIKLIQELKKLNYTIEIETNGTVNPKNIPNYVHFNVSPKLANSFNPEERRIKNEILKEFIKRGSILKFVVSRDDDIFEIQQILTKLNFDPSQIYLMPEASTKEILNQKSSNVLKLCQEYGYNYSHRLHIELFDNKRGV